MVEQLIVSFQIIVIDIVMAADNAIIIGLIASSFAKTDRKKINLLRVFGAFIIRVIFADVTLSFDNVLGVAAAARNETGLLIFGLLLSVFLVATVATFFANYIKGHKWVGILGLFVILIVAVQLILGGTNEIYPNVLPEFITKII